MRNQSEPSPIQGREGDGLFSVGRIHHSCKNTEIRPIDLAKNLHLALSFR